MNKITIMLLLSFFGCNDINARLKIDDCFWVNNSIWKVAEVRSDMYCSTEYILPLKKFSDSEGKHCFSILSIDDGLEKVECPNE
jgi:hypothetical protein